MGGGELRRRLALCALVALLPSCLIRIGAPPPPPTAGYGEPYRGTGKPIYLKDSRGDWDIAEGGQKITSEQALEATGDPEYEARRQLAKAHNDVLYREGQRNRDRGNLMIKTGVAVAVAGLVISVLGPGLLADEVVTPATMMQPELRDTSAGGASYGAATIGALALTAGIAAVLYGYFGGKKTPPYYRWRTPLPLDRPAYIREHTEAYNEKIGAPALAEQPGGFDVPEPLAPGQRQPPPPRPQGPPPGPARPDGPTKPGPTKTGPTKPGKPAPVVQPKPPKKQVSPPFKRGRR